MTQLCLFDNPTPVPQRFDETRPQQLLARKSDPATSHKAANEIDAELGKLQSLFLKTAKSLSEPATAREIAEAAKTATGPKCEVESIRKRSHELEERGLIRVCGMRRCKYTGKLAETWEVVK